MVAMESAAIRSVLRAFIFPNELQNAIALNHGKISLHHEVAYSERTIKNWWCAKLVGAIFLHCLFCQTPNISSPYLTTKHGHFLLQMAVYCGRRHKPKLHWRALVVYKRIRDGQYMSWLHYMMIAHIAPLRLFTHKLILMDCEAVMVVKVWWNTRWTV